MKKLLVAALSIAAFATPAHAANLLTNGGFDLDTSVPPAGYTIYSAGDLIGGGGWTVVGNGGNSGLNLSTTYTEQNVAFVSQAGPNHFDLTASGNTGFADGVTQSVNTTIGNSYLLSFYLGNADGNSNYTQPSSLALSLNGGTPTIFTNSDITAGTINWKPFTVNFQATSALTTVQFNNATIGDNYAGLDTVSLSAVPEPTTWAMLLLGFGIIGFAMRKRSNVRTTVSYA